MSTNIQECIREVNAFVRGGLPGLSRLRQVLPNIFIHYEINTLRDKSEIIRACNQRPISTADGQDITFVYKTYEPRFQGYEQ